MNKINDWTFPWKITFNTDPPLPLGDNNVSQVNSQKLLGIILDVKLTFEEHLKSVFKKTNKTIGLLQKLSNLLPRQALVTIFKAFVRPHLDYGNVICNQAFNNYFQGKGNPSNIMPV